MSTGEFIALGIFLLIFVLLWGPLLIDTVRAVLAEWRELFKVTKERK